MKIEKCFVCKGELKEVKGGHYKCLGCGRNLVWEGDCWTTLPQQVSVDLSKLKEGGEYSDAVKPVN